MSYNEKVVDHFENPRNVGSLDKEDPDVGTGLVGAPACGDVLRLQIKVNPKTKIIEDAKFKAFGCGGMISASSVMTELILGKTLEEAKSVSNKQIMEELILPVVKIHCSVLAENAIKSAVDDWNKKFEKRLERTCEICLSNFQVKFPSSKKKTCSKDCKNKLTRNIVKSYFSNCENRKKTSIATKTAMWNPSVREKFLQKISLRPSTKGVNHPSYGKERTPEWRKAISDGNKGKLKGKSWDEIMGPEKASIRREQNANSVSTINQALLKNRTSKVEISVINYLEPLGFKNNVKIGKYVVDFVNESSKEIIEIYGLYWHCHESIFSDENQINIHLKISAKEKRKRDSLREEYLRSKGYSVNIFWENELEKLFSKFQKQK